MLAHSGWGDGVYPVLSTLDASGRPLAIHIDLLVVGADDDDDFEADGGAAPRRGLLARLLGRE